MGRLEALVKQKEFGNIWELLLAKLLQFADNKPSENALLCKVILKLLEVPGTEKALHLEKK
jgi:hypothetical protein